MAERPHEMLREQLNLCRGDVTLSRSLALAIYQEWQEVERDRAMLQNSILGMSDAIDKVAPLVDKESNTR